MKKIKVFMSCGVVGSYREDVLEFEDDTTDTEIAEACETWAWEHIDIGWEVSGDGCNDING